MKQGWNAPRRLRLLPNNVQSRGVNSAPGEEQGQRLAPQAPEASKRFFDQRGTPFKRLFACRLVGVAENRPRERCLRELDDHFFVAVEEPDLRDFLASGFEGHAQLVVVH